MATESGTMFNNANFGPQLCLRMAGSSEDMIGTMGEHKAVQPAELTL